MRDVQGDGDAGSVAPREKPFAAKLASDRHAGQLYGHLGERHRMQLAFDSALPACLFLHRLMHQVQSMAGMPAGV